jgi:GntR family transcriptional regulator / MocR family aminotransferase
MDLQLDNQGSRYEQLARALKRAILDGRFAAGSRLPATRTLAQRLGISRNTVLEAYELLCAEELAVTRRGSGTRVAPDHVPRVRDTASQAATAVSRYATRARKSASTFDVHRPHMEFDLRTGIPMMNSALLHAWRRKLAAAALRVGPGYPDPAGFKPLRVALCEYLTRRRGVSCTPDHLLIVGGTQQAVSLTARVVLDEGDTAVIEDPYYEPMYHALLAHGAKVCSVRTDEDGIVVDEISARRPRLIYVTPSHQYPSGSVMSLARRTALLDFAEKHSCWIVEDDYDSEFRYGKLSSPALHSLDLGSRVIFTGTFSKSLFPSMRLGYIVCPPALRSDFFRAKRLHDFGCASIDQAALAVFISSRQFERHLVQSIEELNGRREALLTGLHEFVHHELDVVDSRAGMHMVGWLRQFSYAQLERLLRISEKKGLSLRPIHPYFRQKPKKPGLLIGFANLPPLKANEASRVLAACIVEARQSSG